SSFGPRYRPRETERRSVYYEPPNSCKKLTKRRMFARRPSGRLAESTLDGGTPVALPFYYAEQPACRGLRRRVEPFCNLCDSRWADVEGASRPLTRAHEFFLISAFRRGSRIATP